MDEEEDKIPREAKVIRARELKLTEQRQDALLYVVGGALFLAIVAVSLWGGVTAIRSCVGHVF